MIKHLIILLITLLCLCLIATGDLFAQTAGGMKTITVFTQQGKEIELYKDSYALVVGNGSYTEGWSRLPGTLQDVDEIADALEEHGFSVTLKKDLTKPEFEKVFADFVVNAGGNPYNRLLFYYSGHSYTQKMATGEDLGYLVMVDTPPPEKDIINFKLKAMDIASLIIQTRSVQSRHVLFMFDSCVSDTIINLQAEVTPDHISDSVNQPVRQFITAGRASEQVPGRSVFKQEFLDLIQGKAKDPFPDGYITGEELGAHLSTKVPEYNDGAQHPQHGKIMDPQLNKGDFIFVLPGDSPPLMPIGSIFVSSQPAGAQVMLAGMLQARRTPVRIQDVMAGTHMLKLTLEDYEDYTQQITVEAGREVQVNPTLRRLPPPRKGRSKWPFILGGVIVASGAGVAAYVLTDGFNYGSDSGDSNGQVSQPQTGDLTISINIP
jgi:hypothetical protein